MRRCWVRFDAQDAARLTLVEVGVNDMANASSKAKQPATAKKAAAKKATAKKTAKRAAAKPKKASGGTTQKPALLAGGNPQIPKGEGDAVLQAYIAAMPGWKRDVGRRLDQLIVRAVPNVHKAVKWNSPFYGHQGEGWFLNFHCYTRYVKVAFFRGTSLTPVPPGSSKHPEVRYLDIHEDDEIDEKQLTSWVKQASRLPGEVL
jgi:hypothetical protein